jgi:cysteinyl-tRNA synthetase
MNITDVGHLTSDADTGEDKIEVSAKRERKTAWEIADLYTKVFKKDFKFLNIKSPNIWVKATDTIKDQVDFIKILEKKGFTYKISDGIYFNTAKLKNYGRLWGKKERKIKPGARIKLTKGKQNPSDFALWKFTPPGVKRQMEWDSPWGRGFPGWHTECVVMSRNYLGVPFDIHCGGIDHIFIHHTNEIAQSEAALGDILAKFWLHGEFLTLKSGRMGKSEGNIITLENLIEKGFNPLAFRYLCLTAHYRSKLIFSWESLKASQNALDNLYQKIRELRDKKEIAARVNNSDYKKRFLEFINDDLNAPKALALMQNLIKDKNLSNREKYQYLLDFDKIFGLDLGNVKKTKVPQKVYELVKEREEYRKKGNWQKADEIRKKIKDLGYQLEDTKEGPKIKKL